MSRIKLRSFDDGKSTLGILLAVFVLVVAITGVYIVLRSYYANSSSSDSSGLQTYTNTKVNYTLSYPSDWSQGAEQQSLASGGIGTPLGTTDYLAPTSQIGNVNKTSSSVPEVMLYAYSTTSADFITEYNQGAGYSGTSSSSMPEETALTINGNSAYKLTDNTLSSVTEISYLIHHKSTVLILSFREKQSPPAGSTGAVSFDNSSYLSLFDQIAKSVKFN
ncbi:MAG: hypothetical protein ACHQUB_00495 [Candidatus Saccharimonadia bacterium]